MEKWKCKVCGYVHEGPITADFTCPICRASADKFEKVVEAAARRTRMRARSTEKNLWEAFAGEVAGRATSTPTSLPWPRRQGFEQIAALFLKTAENEKEHAKLWFKAPGRAGRHARKTCCTRPRARTPSGRTCTTRMAREADEEGFHELAEQFRGVAAIEKAHEERYRALLAQCRGQARV